MTKQLARIGLLVLMTLMAAGTSGNAQTLEQTLTANIPFDFSVANEKLPAGEYSFRRSQQSDGDQVIEINSRDGKTVVTRITIPVLTIAPKKSARVTFHRYGEQYFLSEIWPAGATTGRSLPKSRGEREIERKTYEVVGVVAF